jgi:hypothetical protein
MLICLICREKFPDAIDLVAHLSAQHHVLPNERTVGGAHFTRRRSDEEFDGRFAVVGESFAGDLRRRKQDDALLS